MGTVNVLASNGNVTSMVCVAQAGNAIGSSDSGNIEFDPVSANMQFRPANLP